MESSLKRQNLPAANAVFLAHLRQIFPASCRPAGRNQAIFAGSGPFLTPGREQMVRLAFLPASVKSGKSHP